MGRKARERARRKAAEKVAGRRVAGPLGVQSRPTRPLLILWGLPGAGKSTFARWLQSEKDFDYIDTDSLANGVGSSLLEKTWIAAINRHGPPDAFTAAVADHGRSVVVEFGLWATPDNIALLAEFERLGAVPWWFDGDRDAALEAWRAENVRSSRPFTEELRQRVVRAMDDNWPLLDRLYGVRQIRTIEAGPAHMDPESIYAAMSL